MTAAQAQFAQKALTEPDLLNQEAFKAELAPILAIAAVSLEDFCKAIAGGTCPIEAVKTEDVTMK